VLLENIFFRFPGVSVLRFPVLKFRNSQKYLRAEIPSVEMFSAEVPEDFPILKIPALHFAENLVGGGILHADIMFA